MHLPNTRGQIFRDQLFDASGTIASGGTAQLLLPERRSTSLLLFQNISDTAMFIKFGSARATASITNGVVTSIAVTDGGAGFTYKPNIQLLGGGVKGWNTNDGGNVGCGQPGYMPPDSVACATAVMSGVSPNMSVNTITVDYGGSGYGAAPYVFITNSLRDPNGYAIASATSGIQLPANMTTPFLLNGTACPTDPIPIFCATTGKAFTCNWMQ